MPHTYHAATIHDFTRCRTLFKYFITAQAEYLPRTIAPSPSPCTGTSNTPYRHNSHRSTVSPRTIHHYSANLIVTAHLCAQRPPTEHSTRRVHALLCAPHYLRCGAIAQCRTPVLPRCRSPNAAFNIFAHLTNQRRLPCHRALLCCPPCHHAPMHYPASPRAVPPHRNSLHERQKRSASIDANRFIFTQFFYLAGIAPARHKFSAPVFWSFPPVNLI